MNINDCGPFVIEAPISESITTQYTQINSPQTQELAFTSSTAKLVGFDGSILVTVILVGALCQCYKHYKIAVNSIS